VVTDFTGMASDPGSATQKPRPDGQEDRLNLPGSCFPLNYKLCFVSSQPGL